MQLCFWYDDEHISNMDEQGLSNIQAICQTSSMNAEAIIWFPAYESYGRLWNTILNNCNKISFLYIFKDPYEYVVETAIPSLTPTHATRENLAKISELAIPMSILNDSKFHQLTKNLINVTKLDIWGHCAFVAIFDESILSLQTFFNQITYLMLPADFMKSVMNSSIFSIKYNSLTTLEIDIINTNWWKKTFLIKKFCRQNPSVRHLKILFANGPKGRHQELAISSEK